MQVTLTELVGFFGIIMSIATGVWIINDRFGKLEGRVGRLEEKFLMIEKKIALIEEKLEEVLFYITPKFKHKKKKLYRKSNSLQPIPVQQIRQRRHTGCTEFQLPLIHFIKVILRSMVIIEIPLRIR